MLKVQIRLVDVLHHELARAGEADSRKARPGKVISMIAPGRPSVAVEHERLPLEPRRGRRGRAIHGTMTSLPWPPRKCTVAGQGELDGIAVVPCQAALRLVRVDLAAAVAAGVREKAARGQACEIAAAQRIGERQRGKPMPRPPTAIQPRVLAWRSPSDAGLPCSAARSAGGRTGRAGAPRSRPSSAAARRRRCRRPSRPSRHRACG